MKKNNLLYTFIVLICLGIAAISINKYNPYLRTDIFRSFAKGNWYILSEQDTLYTMGYFGVRKYLVRETNKFELLAENDTFCTERMMGRGGCVKGEHLYVTARSFLPGTVDAIGNNGKLLIMKRGDLSIVKELVYDIKLVEAKTHENLLVVSGLRGFYIYDISLSDHPEEIYHYKHPKYREYQGFDFIKKDNELYVAFTLFGEGVEIWNITDPTQAAVVCHIPIDEHMADGDNLPGGQSMDIEVAYPYLYTTLGPSSETYRTTSDRRGIIVYDVSNIDSVKKSVVLIPEADWYSKNTGDKQPTYITRYKSKLYVNFAEKGVAVFSIDDPAHPQYRGTDDISGEGALIQPIFAGHGSLFAGSYYWRTIYSSEIEAN